MLDDLFPIDWTAFHFLRPVFLWLLIPAGVLLLLGIYTVRQEVSWKKAIAPHLRPYIIRKGSDGVKIRMHVVLFLALSLGILAISGPTWKKIELPGQILETPVVILLDMSQSMMAEDLQPNRLERAKFKIKDLLDEDPRARVALVGFAGTAHTIVPLTKDYEIILSHIDGLSPDIMPFPGSDVAAGIALADSVTSVTDAPGTVLIMTDDLEDDVFDIVQEYALNSGNQVEIMPMSTPSGADIPSVRDENGQPIRSSLDAQVLSQLTSLDHVEVHQLTLDNSDVEAISSGIRQNLLFTEEPQEKKDDWRDAGLLLVIPMILLFLASFRKGWVLYLFPVLLLSSCTEGTSFTDWWYTPDYQGQRYSDQGQFEEAATHYTDPMRQGVAYFRAGDYDDAIQAFNQDTTAQGAYNLGLAYFQNGDTLAAQLAFGQAVALDPGMEQAQKNVQMLSQIKGEDGMNANDAQEASTENAAQNKQNDSMEDLGGGGQEATEEDMKTERREETVTSNVHMGKELDTVPDNIQASMPQDEDAQIRMRKVDDDPSLFLKRKFAFQVREKKIKPKSDAKKY